MTVVLLHNQSILGEPLKLKVRINPGDINLMIGDDDVDVDDDDDDDDNDR